mmetsp:Transcript_9210/g.14287  ORF Transcript_9210/g.14287 Transcript_9210/m.14287 type:complete len:349 (+) Transcript_9210:196-1242(+)
MLLQNVAAKTIDWFAPKNILHCVLQNEWCLFNEKNTHNEKRCNKMNIMQTIVKSFCLSPFSLGRKFSCKGMEVWSHQFRENFRIIGEFLGCAFFWSPNVDFIVLESHDRLVDHCKKPRTGTNPGSFQYQTKPQQNVHKGIRQKGHGKGRCDQLPRYRTKVGRDNGTEYSRVEKVLNRIRNTKNIIHAHLNVECRDAGNDKETKRHKHLSSNHKGGKVLSFPPKQEFTGASCHGMFFSAFVLGKLRHGKKGNLHPLEHSHQGHEQEKNAHGYNLWNARPHICLSVKKCRERNGKGKTKNAKGPNDPSPKPKFAHKISRGFVGFYRSTRAFVCKHSNNVTNVHDARLFNE